MMKSILFFFLTLVSVANAAYANSFINDTITIGKNKYIYKVSLPKEMNKQTSYPLVLFLHGAAERGIDGAKQTNVGLGKYVDQINSRHPFIGVFPQCPAKRWWSDSVCEKMAIRALHKTLNKYKVDYSRLYLTGLSMGGFGAWYLGSKYTNTFAAIAPIAGRTHPAGNHLVPPGSVLFDIPKDKIPQTVAKNLFGTPVWIVHGTKDKVVPVHESRKMFAALKSYSTNVHYREIKEAYHNSWDQAYQDNNMINWLFKQKKEIR